MKFEDLSDQAYEVMKKFAPKGRESEVQSIVDAIELNHKKVKLLIVQILLKRN